MKKILIIFSIICIAYTLINKKNVNVIPAEAIRLRIVANSNSIYDQNIKLDVKKEVEENLYKLLKDTKGIEEARSIINENLDNIKYDIDTLLTKKQYNQPFTINFGLNYFPSKEYKGIIYDEGMYESLLITLGSGNGDNWWCVLFPPLCLLEAEESDEVEYKFFIKELIDKYL